jgi:type VI secretion system protein ImpH
MVASVWGTDPPLEKQLFDEGYCFEFFQAVRLLGLLYPEREPLGGPLLSSEAVRFHAHQSLNFPPSEIHTIDRPSDSDSPANMTGAFLGLTGPVGVLPVPYTELLLERRKAKDHALADFLDLFNHRLISLFYRAWEKHRLFVAFERNPLDTGQGASFTHYLFDLIGMGTAGLRGRLEVPDQALLIYAGLLAQSPRSACALEAMLSDYFGVPVRVEQFLGKWFSLERMHLSYLDREGLHNQLGLGAIAGDAVWNHQASFRVWVGPLPLDRFRSFLPGEKGFCELIELSRFFTDRTFDFDIRLILRAGEVPWFQLTDEGSDAPRLGLVSWLKTETFEVDVDDAEFASWLESDEPIHAGK